MQRNIIETKNIKFKNRSIGKQRNTNEKKEKTENQRNTRNQRGNTRNTERKVIEQQGGQWKHKEKAIQTQRGNKRCTT